MRARARVQLYCARSCARSGGPDSGRVPGRSSGPVAAIAAMIIRSGGPASAVSRMQHAIGRACAGPAALCICGWVRAGLLGAGVARVDVHVVVGGGVLALGAAHHAHDTAAKETWG